MSAMRTATVSESENITTISLAKEEEPQFWSYEDYLRKTFNKNWKPVREDYSPLNRSARVGSPDKTTHVNHNAYKPQTPSPKKQEFKSSPSPKRSPTFLASSIQLRDKEAKKVKSPAKKLSTSSPKKKPNLVEQVAAMARKAAEEQRQLELQQEKLEAVEHDVVNEQPAIILDLSTAEESDNSDHELAKKVEEFIAKTEEPDTEVIHTPPVEQLAESPKLQENKVSEHKEEPEQHKLPEHEKKPQETILLKPKEDDYAKKLAEAEKLLLKQKEEAKKQHEDELAKKEEARKREDAERKAKENIERKMNEEIERRVREETEKRIAEETKRIKEEADRIAKMNHQKEQTLARTPSGRSFLIHSADVENTNALHDHKEEVTKPQITKSESLKDIKSLMDRVRETTAKAQKPVEVPSQPIPVVVVTPEQTYPPTEPSAPADGPPPPPPPPAPPAPKATTNITPRLNNSNNKVPPPAANPMDELKKKLAERETNKNNPSYTSTPVTPRTPRSPRPSTAPVDPMAELRKKVEARAGKIESEENTRSASISIPSLSVSAPAAVSPPTPTTLQRPTTPKSTETPRKSVPASDPLDELKKRLAAQRTNPEQHPDSKPATPLSVSIPNTPRSPRPETPKSPTNSPMDELKKKIAERTAQPFVEPIKKDVVTSPTRRDSSDAVEELRKRLSERKNKS